MLEFCRGPLLAGAEAEFSMASDMSEDELVRLFAHEGLRLFHDRLVHDAEREWVNEVIDNAARKHFAGANRKHARLGYHQLLHQHRHARRGLVTHRVFPAATLAQGWPAPL